MVLSLRSSLFLSWLLRWPLYERRRHWRFAGFGCVYCFRAIPDPWLQAMGYLYQMGLVNLAR